MDSIFDLDRERRLRREVETQLGELPDEGWDLWMGRLTEDEEALPDSELVDLLVDLITCAERSRPRRRSQRPAVGKNPVTYAIPTIPAPEWWTAHTQEVLEDCRKHQYSALELFGLSGPISPQVAYELIEREVAQQERTGSQLILEYVQPKVAPSNSNTQVIRVPAYSSTPRIAGPPDRTHTFIHPQDGQEVTRRTWGQPLHRLAALAIGVAHTTGCRVHEATAYLLSDTPFTLPWVEVETRADSGVIDMRIGAASVPAKVVREAYVRALKWQSSNQPAVLVHPRPTRGARSRTTELVDFVAARQPGQKSFQDWEQLREEWQRERKGLKPFPTAEAMREAHRRAMKDGH